MLVLGRQRNESIIINDNIEIIIVDARRNNVRVGINAPEDVPIYRKELYEQINRDRRDGLPEE